MAEKSTVAAPHIGAVPDVSESDTNSTRSGTRIPALRFLGRQREGLTFDTSGLETHYKPIDSYEGIHRYDPKFEWEPEEERRVVRKIDKRICSWVCLMFFALQLDRGNISQALSDNLLKDLHMNTNDYNYGQTIFFVSFLAAELPSQLVSKKLGPDNWIPIQMVSWSLVASMQAFLSGRKSFYACRALLGLIEGGFIPDNILYLSYFYTGWELPARLSWFWVSYQSTQIISAFLAYGILRLRGFHGMEGWRWLFALEGMLTGLIGIVSWFYLPPSPTQTASRFRGKDGWFNEHEEKIMVNRILRDDPSKGGMHNRQALSFRMLWDCLADYHMWFIYLIGLTWLIPTQPMNAYLTLQLRSLGFDTFETNLLTIPAYVLFILQLLFWTWLSERLNERFLIALLSQVWTLPLVIALEVLPKAVSPWSRWVISTLMVGHPYVHAILVAITSRNAGSVRTRTVASAMYNMCVQASNIIAVNIYRDDDKPLYRRGNKVLIAICAFNFVIFIGAKLFYVQVNRRREKVWGRMSAQEKDHYLATTKDKGNKRLDFRFAH
ncbi:MFS general substrate transporter [Westerdykella ornata]|uniref:MFS general substrate transporter n=1 Tax=Westerdykella ornata TaxID=318751 RepID=A0A6A6JC79_WESOR|nr:MFS general substrate transporter [Westerdykella ornata]KAF2272799.1 MFS general substrate transporter [Westerdykella ornata]